MMRNKSESKAEALRRLPLLPLAYEWRIICGQPQAWRTGRGAYCFCHVHDQRTLQEVVGLVWERWTRDSGLTRERYLELLNFEDRCHNGEECQACADREESEISTALEEALW